MSNPFVVLLPSAFLTLTLALAFLATHLFLEVRRLRKRYSRIIDLEAEITDATRRLNQAKHEYENFEKEHTSRRATLEEQYKAALEWHDQLTKEISVLEEHFEDMSFGLYKPHFNFQTSEDYKIALGKLRDKERALIRSGQAATCSVEWTINQSREEGARMASRSKKLILRAFNGECDAAIANVSWSNINTMLERVRKSFEAINRLGEPTKVYLTLEYLALKLDEIRLTNEYETKRYKEKEQQRSIREQIRDEEKAQQEFEVAQKEAEEEEARYQRALEEAREEQAKAAGAQLEKLTDQIRSLEAKLEAAREKKPRPRPTGSGFVYVISNIGSFGEGIYKIGLTRRLEPKERIAELSDASVPFPFDIHALMYSNNAFELETAIHEFFEERQLNQVNPRKEFYRNIDLQEIEAFVRDRGLSAEFTKYPEAREYRETLAIQQEEHSSQPPKTSKYPEHAFGESKNGGKRAADDIIVLNAETKKDCTKAERPAVS